jgi:hypothetical protein
MSAGRGLLRVNQRGHGEQGKGENSTEKHLHWLLKGLDNSLR